MIQLWRMIHRPPNRTVSILLILLNNIKQLDLYQPSLALPLKYSQERMDCKNVSDARQIHNLSADTKRN